jgi:hypothetical protein
MKLNIFILSLLLFTSFSQVQREGDDPNKKLVFLLTHFRHGARAPQKYYNQTLHLDYILEKWDNPGELTPMGQRMHYALGLQNRERYITEKKFLKETFDPHEILIYSTRFNRTILSVASQLQGLYPLGTGGELNDEQKEEAIPQVNLSENVKKELDKLNNYSLPGKMALAPIRMINDNERKIIIYDIPECLWKRDEMREINLKNSPELQELITNFSLKYNQTLDEMYEANNTYDIHFVDNFCDAFIAGTTEKKPMEKINEKFNESEQKEILDTCFEFMKFNFREWIAGDSERILPTLEVSKLMREFIHYMKERIDADIKNIDISQYLEDYSKPKMLMISAHDSTISMWELFFIKVFKNNDENEYIFPKFATQLAFEVVTDNTSDTSKIKEYKDYTINCYFNDILFFSKNVQEFIDQVEPKLFSDDKINEVCKFDQKESNEDDTDKKDLYFTLMIVFSATTGIFLILMIFFIVKATRSKTSETIDKEGLLLKNYE